MLLCLNKRLKTSILFSLSNWAFSSSSWGERKTPTLMFRPNNDFKGHWRNCPFAWFICGCSLRNPSSAFRFIGNRSTYEAAVNDCWLTIGAGRIFLRLRKELWIDLGLDVSTVIRITSCEISCPTTKLGQTLNGCLVLIYVRRRMEPPNSFSFVATVRIFIKGSFNKHPCKNPAECWQTKDCLLYL